jgi:hypothetical protein
MNIGGAGDALVDHLEIVTEYVYEAGYYATRRDRHVKFKDECYTVPKMECKTDYSTVRDTEVVERQVPHGSCSDTSEKSCHKVSREVCEDIAREACEEVPSETCIDVSREECRDVPRQEPHHVTKYVDLKHCEDITAASCKPGTKTSCNDHVKNMPRLTVMARR